MKAKLTLHTVKELRKNYPTLDDILELADSLKEHKEIDHIDDAVMWRVYYTCAINNYGFFLETWKYRRKHTEKQFFNLLYDAYTIAYNTDASELIKYTKRG